MDSPNAIRCRIIIKDIEGNIVPSAQIHFVLDLRDSENKPFNGAYIKENIIFCDNGVPACNPLICDSMGSTHSLFFAAPYRKLGGV